EPAVQHHDGFPQGLDHGIRVIAGRCQRFVQLAQLTLAGSVFPRGWWSTPRWPTAALPWRSRAPHWCSETPRSQRGPPRGRISAPPGRPRAPRWPPAGRVAGGLELVLELKDLAVLLRLQRASGRLRPPPGEPRGSPLLHSARCGLLEEDEITTGLGVR